MVVTFHENVKFNDDEERKAKEEESFIFKLKQQRLEGQIPIVTRQYAISVTVFFGLLFLGISHLLGAANKQVVLIRTRYDNVTNGFVDIVVDRNLRPPVYFYYELRNTYMMHRFLNQGFCKNQLLTGDPTNCDTYKNRNYACENSSSSYFFIPGFSSFCLKDQQFYAPVGGAASIMFNDYFNLTLNGQQITWTEKGVISDKLRNIFFEPDGELCDAEEFRNTVKPINWKDHLCQMGGYRNITLIKWLESATNKNFKKLYRILDVTKHGRGLKRGKYRLYVDNVYNPGAKWPNKNYKLEKYFWILHPSWLGTEQTFLQIMYLIVGTGLLALSCFLVGFQIFMMDRRKKYEDDADF